MASNERTEYLLRGHRALFNQNPSKKALMEHIKLLAAELEQYKAAPQPDTVPDKCPQCGSQEIKIPRGDTTYCEDCGWPDENFVDLMKDKPDTVAVDTIDAFDLGMQFQQMIGGSCYDGRDVQRILTAPEFQAYGVDYNAVDGQAGKGAAIGQAKRAILTALKARALLDQESSNVK